MKFIKYTFLLLLFYYSLSSKYFETENNKNNTEKKENSSNYSGLKFRSIGPLMSGRISDIVIHPENENLWYVTTGSGGV